MSSQLRRSASSVGANIAEGTGRRSRLDYVRFLIISRGSAQETINHLLLASDLKYLDALKADELINRYQGLSAALNVMMNTLQRKSPASSAAQSLSL